MTGTQVVHTTEDITPELAQKYLDRNRLNRPIKEWRVTLLVADMLAGHFAENGEAGVTFDWNNNIAGGQHTLTAVVRSGVTVRMRVTRGVDPAARATMNDTLKQKFSDDLAVSGVGHATFAEPLLRKVLVWERIAKDNKGAGGLASWKNTRMSRAQLAAEWPRYSAGITNTTQATTGLFDLWTGVGNRGALQIFWWVVTEKYGYSETIMADFFSRIVYGSQDAEDRVLFQKLRRRLADDRSAEVQVFWLMRVWNAWISGEQLTKLQEPKGGISDPYPKLRRPR